MIYYLPSCPYVYMFLGNEQILRYPGEHELGYIFNRTVYRNNII